MTASPGSGISALATRLGVPDKHLAGLDTCGAQGLDRIERLVAQAFDREDEAVETGLQETLQAVPRPLRGRARALLFPGSSR